MPLSVPSSVPPSLVGVTSITNVQGQDFNIFNSPNTTIPILTVRNSDGVTILASGLFVSGAALFSGNISTTSAILNTGLQLYNTADEVTNFERVSLFWNANTAELKTEAGGGGTTRALRLTAANGGVLTLRQANTLGFLQLAGTTNSVAGQMIANIGGNTNTATAPGTNVGLNLNPTYNQLATGLTNNTDLLVNRTQTSVTSGIQNLIDLQVSNISKMRVDNSGNMFASGYISTAPVTGNLLPSTWKFGPVRTGTALTVSTTNGLQVFIDGTLYTIPILSTNP